MSETDLLENFYLMQNTAAPVTVSFDVTSKCNLRCVHCFNNSGGAAPHTDLSSLGKLEIAKQVAALHPHSVCLCGGETLCCENLLEIIDVLSPCVGKISMVSNGYAVTKEIARQLKEHGLYLVQISVDGANAWQHDTFRGVGGSFEHAVSALDFLKEAGIPQIFTSFVPNKLNIRSLEEYAGLCYSLGVHAIRAMPFLPSGRGRSVGRRLMPDAQEYFEFCRVFTRLQVKYAGRMELEWGDPLDHMRRMAQNARHGLHSFAMEIKSDGNLTGTTYLPVVVGNCTWHTLKEYWDAGYKLLWADRRFTHFTEQIRTVNDLDTFEPQPYGGENILIDIMEGTR